MRPLLTERELLAIDLIGANPSISIQQIARALGLRHKGQAARLLTGLQDLGLLSRRSRSVRGAKGSSFGGLQLHQSSPTAAQ